MLQPRGPDLRLPVGQAGDHLDEASASGDADDRIGCSKVTSNGHGHLHGDGPCGGEALAKPVEGGELWCVERSTRRGEEAEPWLQPNRRRVSGEVGHLDAGYHCSRRGSRTRPISPSAGRSPTASRPRSCARRGAHARGRGGSTRPGGRPRAMERRDSTWVDHADQHLPSAYRRGRADPVSSSTYCLSGPHHASPSAEPHRDLPPAHGSTTQGARSCSLRTPRPC